ncbi:Uncharacterised protein [Elizabethkingia meningoseptica]|nr:Uncharacterised protein [Elizabethkingia meningoseptica]
MWFWRNHKPPYKVAFFVSILTLFFYPYINSNFEVNKTVLKSVTNDKLNINLYTNITLKK